MFMEDVETNLYELTRSWQRNFFAHYRDKSYLAANMLKIILFILAISVNSVYQLNLHV